MIRARDRQRQALADTCREYIVPRMLSAGWREDQIIEERFFTDRRVVLTVTRKQAPAAKATSGTRTPRTAAKRSR
jgi:hypothetical protein